MNRVLRITFAVLAMAVIALGADNTLGTWKYNAAKSKPAPGLSPIKNLTLVREASGGGVKQTAKGERADGSKIDNSYTAKYGGDEAMLDGKAPTWDMVGIKQVNANTVTEDRSKMGGKYKSTLRVVISAAGKTMTATAKGTDANGKPFSSVAVFDKQ